MNEDYSSLAKFFEQRCLKLRKNNDFKKFTDEIEDDGYLDNISDYLKTNVEEMEIEIENNGNCIYINFFSVIPRQLVALNTIEHKYIITRITAIEFKFNTSIKNPDYAIECTCYYELPLNGGIAIFNLDTPNLASDGAFRLKSTTKGISKYSFLEILMFLFGSNADLRRNKLYKNRDSVLASFKLPNPLLYAKIVTLAMLYDDERIMKYFTDNLLFTENLKKIMEEFQEIQNEGNFFSDHISFTFLTKYGKNIDDEVILFDEFEEMIISEYGSKEFFNNADFENILNKCFSQIAFF